MSLGRDSERPAEAAARLGDADSAALRAASEELARLRAERREALRDLARVRLDRVRRRQSAGDVGDDERRALALLADRRLALEHLAERRQQALNAQRQARAERDARARALEEAAAAVATFRAAAAPQIRAGAAWSAERARIDEMARVAEEAEKKAVQAEADREQKRRPYEVDPLFMYLWKRRFGTAEYRAMPLVRFLDRKVARLVGYDAARANYFMLNEIPARLRAHAERLRAEVEAGRTRLAAIERTELAKSGIEPLEAKVAEAEIALEQAEDRLAEADAEVAALDREQDEAAAGSDVGHREAIELLAAAASRRDIGALRAQAVRSPDSKNDEIVRRIHEIEAAIARSEHEIIRIRREISSGGRTGIR